MSKVDFTGKVGTKHMCFLINEDEKTTHCAFYTTVETTSKEMLLVIDKNATIGPGLLYGASRSEAIKKGNEYLKRLSQKLKFSQTNIGQLFGYGKEVVGYHQVLKLIADKSLEHPLMLIKESSVEDVLHQVYEDHQNGVNREEYPMDTHDSSIEIDFNPLQAKERRLIMLPTGEPIYFKDGTKFIIRTKSLRHLIVTKESDGSQYSIIDTIGGICGPNDRTFNPYNMNDNEDIKQSLKDLEKGKINISHIRKRGSFISEVIDLEKTFDKAFGW